MDTHADVERPLNETESAETSTGGEPRFERKWTKRGDSSRSVTTSAVNLESGEATPSPEIQAELARQKERADDLYARLQRALADQANQRKRLEQEREEMAKFAGMMFVTEILPVLDNFERALQTLPRELEQFTWIQGIVLIARQLQAVLDRFGVKPIEAVGQAFNPSLHEAIVEEETAEHAPGTVVAELQRGYTMHGYVIRPTLAKVAHAPRTPAETGTTDADSEQNETTPAEGREIVEEAATENLGP